MIKSFEEIRGEVLEEARQQKEKVIETWLNEIGYKYNDPVGYDFNLGDKMVHIYTTKPGGLIGKGGVNVEKFKRILSEEFGGEWTINFTEIRGGFVNVYKHNSNKENPDLKHYRASGMTLVDGNWQSCGWTIEASSFTEAAKIAEADETFRLHSLSDNVMY
jgi:hypothetical protein